MDNIVIHKYINIHKSVKHRIVAGCPVWIPALFPHNMWYLTRLSFISDFDKMILTFRRWLGMKCRQLASSEAVVYCGGTREKRWKETTVFGQVILNRQTDSSFWRFLHPWVYGYCKGSMQLHNMGWDCLHGNSLGFYYFLSVEQEGRFRSMLHLKSS